MVAVVPTLCRVIATIGTEHPAATETDLERDVVDRRVTGGDEARDQTRIIGRGGQQVAGSEVTRPHAVLPRQPLRSQQRAGARNQNHLADGGTVGTGVAGQYHRPLPTLIARQRG